MHIQWEVNKCSQTCFVKEISNAQCPFQAQEEPRVRVAVHSLWGLCAALGAWTLQDQAGSSPVIKYVKLWHNKHESKEELFIYFAFQTM